jgi:phage terminase Nu1 subunit (DNA packaging protein)
MAICEVCSRAFQVHSQGCTIHKYKHGHNEAVFNANHKNGLWRPKEAESSGEDEQEPQEEAVEAPEASNTTLTRTKTKTGKGGKKVVIQVKRKGSDSS